MATFDSTKIQLAEILKEVVAGKVQLPEFQRGWVWDEEHIRSLLISIARTFPIGAVMLLRNGGTLRFAVRPAERVELSSPPPNADRLILDGQQRLTSLTQVLMLDGPVITEVKGASRLCHFYIDIAKAMADESLESAFIVTDKDRMIRSDFNRKIDLDLSNRQRECELLYFPCREILNSDSWEQSLHKFSPEKFGEYMEFRKKILKAFRDYLIPVIELHEDTTKEAVCLVFEKVNQGGVPLSAFDLITASYAADGYNLREDWFGPKGKAAEGRQARLRKEAILRSIESTDFLQAVTLLHTYDRRLQDLAEGKTGKAVSAVTGKRSAVLSLPLDSYLRLAATVEKGFIETAKFLRMECFYSVSELPYRTQLIPLAATLGLLGERWREPKIHSKLAQWFWCGVLGELYGGAVETRAGNDLEDLMAWVKDEIAQPRTVYDASFQPARLNTMRSRGSAAYKGISTLLLREGAKDLFWKAGVKQLDLDEARLDIHHLFPKAWCIANGIPSTDYDSIINKALISAKANRMIGGRAPSEYVEALQNHKSVGRSADDMDDLLRSHLIDPAAFRANDFYRFFEERKQDLLALVELAMGKDVAVPPAGEEFENGVSMVGSEGDDEPELALVGASAV
jgi:hypothetical protein